MSPADCALAMRSTRARIHADWKPAIRSRTRPGWVSSSAAAAAKKHPPGNRPLLMCTRNRSDKLAQLGDRVGRGEGRAEHLGVVALRGGLDRGQLEFLLAAE